MTPDMQLRELRESDLEELCRWRVNPEVSRFLANRVKNLDEATEWFHRISQNPDNLLTGILVDGKLVGYGIVEGVDVLNGKCEMGVVIGHPKWWGKGIGKGVVAALLQYCFDRLSLHRVLAVILRGNVRSEVLFRQLGFTHEGTLREAVKVDGEHVDLLCYSILKTEYIPLPLPNKGMTVEW